MNARSQGSGGIKPSPLAAALALLILLTAAGCAVQGSKAGPLAPATVLHFATAEARGAPYSAAVEHFAQRVTALTEGSVRVVVDYETIPWTPASEQELLRMVQGGELDLALVPPRVFDTVGITSFQALQTPLLIDSPEVAGAVVTSGLGGRMLDGLRERHLAGLGLVYEGLRRPLALNGAITRRGDFDGLTVRVATSDLSDRVFAALGATPDHGASHVISTNGQPYAVVETEFSLARTDFATPSIVTANLVFFPKYDAILANPDALARLTETQREAVRRAAEETALASVQTSADEEKLAAAYCETGGALASAPDSEVAALADRLQPVTDALLRDPQTREAIETIGALKASTAVPAFVAPPACRAPTGDGARLPSAPAAPKQ